MQNLPVIRVSNDSAEVNDSYTHEKTAVAVKAQRFAFDPNTVSFDQLRLLGLTERVARTLISFRKKGFVFKKKEDLKKVYGLSEKLFSELQAYVLLAGGSPEKNSFAAEGINGEGKKDERKAAEFQAQIIELNSADSISLLSLSGIGPVFARKIIKYRSLLGGYNTKEQLNEVYGFNEELFGKVKDHVSVNASLIQKINVNSDDFKTVNRHPYIEYEHTKRIFELRRHKKLDAEDVRFILNDEAAFNKILPYLSY